LLQDLQRARAAIDGVVRVLDPDVLAPADASRLLDEAIAIERAGVALRVLVADRASLHAPSWTGHRSPEEALAQRTGTSYGEAKKTLESSHKLRDLPKTQEALRKGELSSSQLNEIGPAATPENEGRLLDSARNEDARGLKKVCETEKRKARTEDDERRRHERIRKDRHYKSWTDHEGAYCYSGRTTADEGAKLEAAICAQADKEFKAAYAEGRREPAGAYRSDAVLSLITGGGGAVKTEVVIRVDADKLAGGEGICETDQGPVPVDVAIGAMLAGAFVKVIATDGVDVTKVAHVGRTVPALLKTAIVERDGGRCVRPGCSSAHRLEVHHYRCDFAKGGPTTYDNLATLCSFDHDLVTTKGHRLAGKPGGWRWIEPPRRC